MTEPLAARSSAVTWARYRLVTALAPRPHPLRAPSLLLDRSRRPLGAAEVPPSNGIRARGRNLRRAAASRRRLCHEFQDATASTAGSTLALARDAFSRARVVVLGGAPDRRYLADASQALSFGRIDQCFGLGVSRFRSLSDPCQYGAYLLPSFNEPLIEVFSLGLI